MGFRQLEAAKICDTTHALGRRIAERFSGSGLSRVAAELITLANETEARIDRLRRPIWWLRALVIAGIAILLLAALAAPLFISFRHETPGLPELMQGIDSAVNNLVFIALAIWFLATLEQRPKRRAALEALHELRSLAHIVDMHQLTKDPEHVLTPQMGTASSPARTMTRFELARYLDYCAEMLAIVSKLAALYAQYFIDSRVLDAVNDVEQLTGDLSSKIWQKIVILDTIAAREGDAS